MQAKSLAWPSHFCFVMYDEGRIPVLPDDEPLIQTFKNERFSYTFVTEDDMEDPKVIHEKVMFSLGRYGVQAAKVCPLVMIARNPTSRQGRGFPFQVRISIFPSCDEFVALSKYLAQEAQT